MTARADMLGRVRRALGVTGAETTRRREVADRLSGHPAGVIPTRARVAARAQIDLFVRMAELAAASVERVGAASDVPRAVAAFLRSHNLPMRARRGADPRLVAMPWETSVMEMTVGPSEGRDASAISYANAGVAETGTLVLCSGADNPTTLNFLPENHVVAIDASDIVGDYETVLRRLASGKAALPRAINMITGPSRSADIEQTLILGAHGPRRLHIVLIDPAEG